MEKKMRIPILLTCLILLSVSNVYSGAKIQKIRGDYEVVNALPAKHSLDFVVFEFWLSPLL